MVKKDIFREPLDPAEGLQEFSVSEAKETLGRVPKFKRGKFCVVKDIRPSWFDKREWKQTYSIQRADKMKILGRKCSRVKGKN